MKKPIYLPSRFKHRKNTTVVGRAKTGEISQNGLVSFTEDWEGRIASNAAPNAIRYVLENGKFRKMTFQEMVDRGHFILGRGPTGIRPQKEGVHFESGQEKGRARGSRR